MRENRFKGKKEPVVVEGRVLEYSYAKRLGMLQVELEGVLRKVPILWGHVHTAGLNTLNPGERITVEIDYVLFDTPRVVRIVPIAKAQKLPVSWLMSLPTKM